MEQISTRQHTEPVIHAVLNVLEDVLDLQPIVTPARKNTTNKRMVDVIYALVTVPYAVIVRHVPNANPVILLITARENAIEIL